MVLYFSSQYEISIPNKPDNRKMCSTSTAHKHFTDGHRSLVRNIATNQWQKRIESTFRGSFISTCHVNSFNLFC